MKRLLTLASVALAMTSCSPSEDSSGTSDPPTSTTTTASTTPTTVRPTTSTTELPDFSVSSPGFSDGDPIPVENTCVGTDLSPDLDIVGLPAETEAIAIVVEDPDAPLGVWYHWVAFDIPAETGSFDIPPGNGDIGVGALNSWHVEGYMGPCPPEGEEHRYVFRVHALDTMLRIPAGVEAAGVIADLEDATIDTAEVTGVFGR